MMSSDIEDACGTTKLPCKKLAAYASDRGLCVRSLAYEMGAMDDEHASSSSPPANTRSSIDPIHDVSGTAVENYWEEWLRSREGHAKLVGNEPNENYCKWSSFVGALQQGVNGFAAEVKLSGNVSPGCETSGKADFIAIEWRDTATGAPDGPPHQKAPQVVLHIFECKASPMVQAAHRLQVALYAMLIKKKLLSAGGLHVSDEKYALDKIDIRCYVLLGKVRDFRVVDHKLEPLEPEEVTHLTNGLASNLEKGLSTVKTYKREKACDPHSSEAQLLYSMGSHCGTCPARERCWERIERGEGELQLSGCTADQADKLHRAGIRTLLQLVNAAPDTVHTHLELGLDSPVAQVLQARARVRLSRTAYGIGVQLSAIKASLHPKPDDDEVIKLHKAGFTSPHQLEAACDEDKRAALERGLDIPISEWKHALACMRLSASINSGSGHQCEQDVEHRPLAGPSCLPEPVSGMLQVFMSVIVDSVFDKSSTHSTTFKSSEGSVAGVAAKVVLAGSSSSEKKENKEEKEKKNVGDRGSSSNIVNALISDEPDTLPQAPQPAAPKAAVGERPKSAGQKSMPGAVPSADPAEQHEARERKMLLSFLQKLRKEIQAVAGQHKQCKMHFYFHSHKQLRVLLLRCMHFARQPAASEFSDSSSWSTYRQLMWLPELLGLRAGIEYLEPQPPAPWEQQMVSVLAAEMARFLTKWEGTDLVTATQQRWVKHKKTQTHPAEAIFSWRGWPLAADPSSLQIHEQHEGLPPIVLWLAFHRHRHASSNNSSSSSSNNNNNSNSSAFTPDLSRVSQTVQDAATPDRLRTLLSLSVNAMQWLSGRMHRLSERMARHNRTPRPFPIRKEAIDLSYSGVAAATAAGSAKELCRAALQAALLCRAEEVRNFLTDRSLSRTPQQRALDEPESCLIVHTRHTAQEGQLPVLNGRECGFFSGKFCQDLQCPVKWQPNKDDSFWLFPCSSEIDQPQLLKDLESYLPLEVSAKQSATEPSSSSSSSSSSAAATTAVCTVKVPYLAWNPKITTPHQPYSTESQPYLFAEADAREIKMQELLSKAKYAVLERTGLNIGGHVAKNVCERLKAFIEGGGSSQESIMQRLVLPDLPPIRRSEHPQAPPQAQAQLQQLLETLKVQGLHSNQVLALEWMLSSTPRLQLLQGPPGTGKTHTMALAVLIAAQQALKEKKAGIYMISAATKGAIKNLEQRIVALKQSLDLGNAAGRVVVVNVNDMADEHNAAKRGKSEEAGNAGESSVAKRQCACIKKDGSQCAQPARLCSAYCTYAAKHKLSDEESIDESKREVHVVCGTPNILLKLCKQKVDGISKRKGLFERGGASADWLFVDEGSQLPFAALLALATMLQPEGRLFVGGDHRQLPCIQAYDGKDELRPSFIRHLPFLSAYDYLLELHKRAGTDRVAKSSLAYSHRLPKALRDMLQPIYSMDGITLDGRDGAADDPDKKAGGLGDAFKAIWRATEGLFLILHNREGDGKRSATEVKIIEQLLQAKGPWTDEEAVGIIASHKMQRADLNKALDSDKLAKTVDEFQGQEKPSIIFSACVSDQAVLLANESFYASANRATVAFSRAKERLVVCCSKNLMAFLPTQADSTMQLWIRLRAMCKEKGRLLGQGGVDAEGGVDAQVDVYQGCCA